VAWEALWPCLASELVTTLSRLARLIARHADAALAHAEVVVARVVLLFGLVVSASCAALTQTHRHRPAPALLAEAASAWVSIDLWFCVLRVQAALARAHSVVHALAQEARTVGARSAVVEHAVASAAVAWLAELLQFTQPMLALSVRALHAIVVLAVRLRRAIRGISQTHRALAARVVRAQRAFVLVCEGLQITARAVVAHWLL
jgi:hypothetical protein